MEMLCAATRRAAVGHFEALSTVAGDGAGFQLRYAGARLSARTLHYLAGTIAGSSDGARRDAHFVGCWMCSGGLRPCAPAPGHFDPSACRRFPTMVPRPQQQSVRQCIPPSVKEAAYFYWF